MDRGSEDPSYSRLQQLLSISEAALAHLEFDDLIAQLLARVSDVLGADTAAVLLLDEEADELVARAARGLEEEVEAGVRVPLGRGFAGRIAQERRSIIIDDVPSADIYNPILVEKGLRSLVGVPLLVEGRVTGVLHLGTRTPRKFTTEDAALLQLAADRIALAIDHARLYDAERTAAQQLRRLEAITEAALSHLDLDELLDVLLTRIRELIGTDTVVVQLLEPDGRRLTTRATLGITVADALRTVPVGEGFTGRIAAEARPLTTDDDPGGTVASMLGVPLVAGGSVIGVLGVGTVDPREFTQQDVDLLERAADRIALAIENARLFSGQRDAAEQLRRLESITEVALHHISLEDEVLERMVARVREALEVDTAALFVTDESTQMLVARASEGEEVERDVEIPIGRGFAGRVAELREPLRIEDATDFEVVSPLLRERGVKSLLGVPLTVEDRLLGVLFVGTVEPRSFTDHDLALLDLAGTRLAVALDHSRLYEREHMVAETLQRTLLPERLPDLQGADTASRYLPGEGEAVGGDWYDVVPLRDGRVAVAMGDVVSHGLRAASVMGQLRNALRAYALERYEPELVLNRLNGVTRNMDGREMATVFFAIYDPEAGSIEYASGGHPPPLVIGPDGDVTLLEKGQGPPLGAVPDPIFVEGRAELEPGATLLLYTDGVVERRDMWIDEGLKLLVAAAEQIGRDGPEPEELVDRLVATLLPHGRASDDVALLALRAEPAAGGPLRMTLAADPTVLVSMRQSLRQWLADANASEDDAYDILVATTEAAANAIEHAYGPGDATFRVEARRGSGGEVLVTVRDRGAWRPPRGHNRGRGTLLMQELMDHFEVTTGDSGTEVRMSKRLTSALVA